MYWSACISTWASRSVARIAPGLVVLHDHARLPSRFFGRFTAFLRAVMPGLAGVSRMPYPRFLAFNALGGVLWGSACVLLGYFAAHSLATVTKTLGWTSAVCVAVIALGLVLAWHRHRSANRG